jgi:Iap family predicted aminopeptidase
MHLPGILFRSHFVGIFCLVLLPFGLAGRDLPVATRTEIQSSLLEVPCNDAARLGAAKDLFVRMGASESDIAIAQFKELENLVVTVKGRDEGTIIVGAHYDKSKAGCGAVDNWTGIVIMSHLYKSIREANPMKTVVFVAFDKEEAGMLGSRAMADSIPKEERKNYCSMVNLDSFGFALPQVLANISTPKLTSLVAAVAKDNKIQFASASVNADSDSSSFKAKGIPAVTIHGLSMIGPRSFIVPGIKRAKSTLRASTRDIACRSWFLIVLIRLLVRRFGDQGEPSLSG